MEKELDNVLDFKKIESRYNRITLRIQQRTLSKMKVIKAMTDTPSYDKLINEALKLYLKEKNISLSA